MKSLVVAIIISGIRYQAYVQGGLGCSSTPLAHSNNDKALTKFLDTRLGYSWLLKNYFTIHFLQGIFKTNPWLISLPGSSVTDIPVPDDMQKKPTGAPKSGYAVLLPFLQKQGRTVERALGDGNCLFRSLSLQLTGTQDHHIKLRKAIAKFEQTEGVFEKLHKTINRTPFLSHLQKIKKTCVWGTNVEVMATASLFQIDVYVA